MTKNDGATDSQSKDIIKVEGGSIVTPLGYAVSGIYSGVKRKRNDLGAIYSEEPAQAAAVYTLNAVQAAPIKVMKETMAKEQTIQAVIVNSGNANACTGEQGIEDAYTMQKLAAEHFNVPVHYTAIASTGLIGERMPMENITNHIPNLKVGNRPQDADAFCESIRTTDTFNKSVCYQAEINGRTITMGAAAKGSGMIEPNMGTMLSFITTDANVASEHLQEALKEVTNQTFNCITVDGDTSTNDMVLLLANGKADQESLAPGDEGWSTFVRLLELTCESMAKSIARDGEGASKLIDVTVKGAKTDVEARQIGKAIVGSSLVKTAVYGSDANWGRVIAAIGYSQAHVDPEKIDMWFGPIQLLKQSQPTSFSEEEATTYLSGDTVDITVHLHQGDGFAKAWGCDLTYDYVRINASYRT